MRAFLAVPVGPPALQAGTELLERLRGAVRDVRWVRPEGLHLTLHFWATLRDDDVARVCDAARGVTQRHAPYLMQLGDLGSFNDRVLWLGMRGGAIETAALQRDVEDALEAAGFPREPRSFHPHVTLGRPRTRTAAWRAFADAALPPCTVGELHLYRSHPGPGGSRYEVLERLPLSASR